MKENNIVIIITLILLILGVIAFSLILITPDFNFRKSEFKINGSNIKETLYYTADKDYHTLYRNFDSIVNDPRVIMSNSVTISSVVCDKGTPYFVSKNGNFYSSPDFNTPTEQLDYTEANEYGCTFGDNLGFKKDNNYEISSDFTVNPSNLFRINGKYYIKFIAYSKDNHILLRKDKNLFLEGTIVAKSFYLPSEYVIIYIPYEGDTSKFNIIEKNSFEFNTSYLALIIGFLLAMMPSMIFFFSWFFFGRELTYEDIPEQLSSYPRERKAWEIASYFNPPFSEIDQEFFASIMMDFYRRKIIDIKIKDKLIGKDILIKINNNPKDLDEIEKNFLGILNTLKGEAKDKYKEGEYFYLNKPGKSIFIKSKLIKEYKELNKKIKEESKNYLDDKWFGFFIVSLFIAGILCYFFKTLVIIMMFDIISLMMLGAIMKFTAILTSYKKDYYIEYQKWQSFKKWLKYSDSMKTSEPKAVILWEQYLVYATALGVAKRVLAELKKEGIINENQYNFYTGVYVSSVSFAASGGGGGASGGGAGGGGVGGGGGGGR
jgi:uncharacterized membrane protein